MVQVSDTTKVAIIICSSQPKNKCNEVGGLYRREKPIVVIKKKAAIPAAFTMQ